MSRLALIYRQVFFVACIVLTTWAALHAEHPGTREIAYRMFRDLLALLSRRRRD